MSEEVLTMEELDSEVTTSFETFRDDDNAWDKVKKYMEEKTVLTVTVENTAVKGGVIATLEGLRGFIPASHLALSHVDNLEEYQGKELAVNVIDVDESKKHLVLSARAVLRAEADKAKQERINSIEPGTVLEGKVESIKPYGAFIRTEDGLTGLVHVSQISVRRIKDPSAVLKEGDTVKAKVLNVKDGKLSLSIKALDPKASESDAPSEDAELRNVKIPKSEPLSQSMGDLLKNIKL